MGMHVGLIAAKVPVAQLREEFLRQYPAYELVASNEQLSTWGAAWEWKKQHEHFVSAAAWNADNPGKSAYIFWQDGPWALMSDPSYTHAGDEAKLSRLSDTVGTVLSLVVETAGGCAMFGYYQDGERRRWINYSDGESNLTGEPLPEEVGIDVAHFYMDEAEVIWKAFGLSTLEDPEIGTSWQAISVIDRTDYSDLLAKFQQKRADLPQNTSNTAKPSIPKRPWWKIL